VLDAWALERPDGAAHALKIAAGPLSWRSYLVLSFTMRGIQSLGVRTVIA